jgi:FKBP-type peptidyl-prolyl cis-trans isomerase FklB
MISKILLGAFSAAALLTPQAFAQEKSALKDQKDRISYSIGANVGSRMREQMKREGLEINPEALANGLKDALSGAKPLLSDAEVSQTLMSLQQDLAAKAGQLAEKNKKEGEAFLASNRTKAGVKSLPSGLQYQVLKEGKGRKPKPTDSVKANYKGTLIDGTEFDSSEKHGEPAVFPLDGVIKGWTEALQLMPVGSKWRLFIPSSLAYGDGGAGELIGPNATLIFEVELLGIEDQPKG